MDHIPKWKASIFIKLLEENIGEGLSVLGLSEYFLSSTPKEWPSKEK